MRGDKMLRATLRVWASRRIEVHEDGRLVDSGVARCVAGRFSIDLEQGDVSRRAVGLIGESLAVGAVEGEVRVDGRRLKWQVIEPSS